VSLTAAVAETSSGLDRPLPAKQIGPRIFDRFLAACRARPNEPAIVHGGGVWTYAEVDRASRALAIELLAMPGHDDIVALYSRRCGELVIAMLGCARAGLTFAVLDAAYPLDRIQVMLGVLKPGRFVSVGEAEDTVARLALPPSVLQLARVDLAELAPDGRLDAAKPDAIAYVLFTSGTTGVPKCIVTAHTPLVHFVDWYEKTFAVDPTCHFSMLSGLGHDPVLRDIFVPLSTGASLHIPRPATVLDPVKLHTWFAEQAITHAHVTPQLSRILCAGRRGSTLPTLRFLCSGGDLLRSKQANEIVAAAPAAKVVNFYGSTETPQAMAFHVFDPRVDTDEAVPIGRGIDDVQLFVLGNDLTPTVRGQVAIRTRYLSEGYRGDRELTHAKFIANPRSTDPTDRLYLTGDVGRPRADGAVVVEGRLDDQVKIRGFRVELGDVVAQLLRLPQIREAVVLAERTSDGESRLVAYLVAPEGGAKDDTVTATVREAMLAAAPVYMVPSRFVWLLHLPLLPNGKVDRSLLRNLEPEEPETPGDLTPTEAAIAADWRALLGRSKISAEASFISLGGDSLSFIQASVKLEELLGRLPDRWETLSIAALARAKQPGKSRWTSIDSSVFLRAISIVAVVVGHFELPNLAGSVLALFVVSGMSFGRYLVPQVQQVQAITPIVRLVAKIAIPAILYSIVVNVASRLPIWPGVLLANNLVSDQKLVSGVGFWYIDVLVQCFVILAVLLAIPVVRRALSGDPFTFLVGATVVVIALAYAAPYVIDTSHLADRTPLQYLRAVFLGWTLIYATTMPRKLIILALAIPTFADIAWYHEEYVWFPVVAVVYLLFTTRIQLPIYAGRLVNLVASASLFIYLTDHQVQQVLEKTPLGKYPIVMIGLACVAGIVAWKAWEIAVGIAQRTFRRATA